MKKLMIAAMAAGLMAAPASAQDYEVVRQFDRATPPGNVAIGPDGRMFMSLHGFYGPELRIVELLEDGGARPYPTDAWARAPEGDGDGLNGVLGLRVDRSGVLWLLDSQTAETAGRVIGWDTRAERLHAIHYLAPPVTRPTSFLNDLAVDRDHEAVYIADTGDGANSALIVLDLETGRSRRVLEGSRYTTPEDLPMVIDGDEILLRGAPVKLGVNPITVDPTNSWLYFAPMTASAMYRVRTVDLLDASLSDAELEARVERYGDKPISDGSTVDALGNVYVTAVTDHAIGVVKPDGAYEALHQSADDLPWPNGFAIGPDGAVYATINELHRSPVLNGGEDGSSGNFRIVRFPALGPAINGR